jgi:hypothetical protein
LEFAKHVCQVKIYSWEGKSKKEWSTNDGRETKSKQRNLFLEHFQQQTKFGSVQEPSPSGCSDVSASMAIPDGSDLYSKRFTDPIMNPPSSNNRQNLVLFKSLPHQVCCSDASESASMARFRWIRFVLFQTFHRSWSWTLVFVRHWIGLRCLYIVLI